mgnify:CR=1 FL=1|jgi:hypothetical protein|tara:strand:+ start:1741 stop:2808 length:1068 start_codon:yes stop_codon:yes gene_type:complete
MSLEKSLMYKYAPQMKIYNQYSHEWKPYIMFSNPSNVRTEVLNTDNLGLRFNSSNNKNTLNSIFEQEHNKKESGLIIGASTAYGMGASSDEMTISSVLSRNSDIFFYNLGVTAFTGFQEVVLHQSLINHFEKIKHVVIFSGLNDMFMHNYIDVFDYELGPYYYSNQFKTGMDHMLLNKKRIITKFFLSPFFKADTNWLSITKKQIFETIFKNKYLKKNKIDNIRKEDLLKKYLLRNFIYWSNIQKIYKVKMIYVLQPFPKWFDKNLTIEEIEIFKELDLKDLRVHEAVKSLENLYLKSVSYISECCKRFGINFVDSNKYLKENVKQNDWCFIDRSHLTDLGNKYIANLIKSQIIK